jgi:membrane-associated protease RseP (regulator of RpoE activity)
VACLFLLALAAPVSIAATQTAWALALLCWLARVFAGRPAGRRFALDGAVLAFVGLTLLSSVFSYEPLVSLRKMVSVSLVTIVYLAAENLTARRDQRRLAALLLISCAVSAVWAIGWRIAGKNLKTERLTADSPLRRGGVEEGDTIVRVNKQDVNSPDELAAALTAVKDGESAVLRVYRREWHHEIPAPPVGWREGPDAAAKLGIAAWSRGRDTRAAGFYGHYTTYAEMLQLVSSLALGLLVALFRGEQSKIQNPKSKILLALALAGYLVALFLTVTRASWASFLLSAGVIVLLGAGRRAVLVLAVSAVPLVLAGVFVLQQKRGVGFLDAKDGSTAWRKTVWREGFNLLVSSPRHLLTGIGLDSLKTHWQEWKMFDNGKLPIGHMHSDMLHLALERGVPALLAWLAWLALFWRELWRGLRRKRREQAAGGKDWFSLGVLLGAFGGSLGFFTSGLVHYNWGDSEVVMVFYLLMGLSLAVLVNGQQPNVEG